MKCHYEIRFIVIQEKTLMYCALTIKIQEENENIHNSLVVYVYVHITNTSSHIT